MLAITDRQACLLWMLLDFVLLDFVYCGCCVARLCLLWMLLDCIMDVARLCLLWMLLDCVLTINIQLDFVYYGCLLFFYYGW